MKIFFVAIVLAFVAFIVLRTGDYGSKTNNLILESQTRTEKLLESATGKKKTVEN